ncbi:MAG: tetratricopeptide repeat protein [Verrucomicrobiia bacterium]
MMVALGIISSLAPAQDQAGTGTADDLLQRGSSAFNAGNFPEAAKIYENFLASYGSSPEAQKVKPEVYPLLAASYLQIQKPEAAEPIIETYLKEYPQGKAVPDMSFWLGLSRYQQGKFNEAISAFETFLKNYPNTPQISEAQMLMANSQFQEKKYKEAAALFEIASKTRDPLTAERAMLMRLQSLLESRDLDGALAVLEILRAKPEPIRQQALLALQAMQLGDDFYEDGEYNKAYRCYLFIPLKAQILDKQEKLLADVEKQLTHYARGLSVKSLQLQQMKDGLLREKENLTKMETFDLNRHLRVAQCALQCERPGEGYLAAIAVAETQPRSEPVIVGHYLAILAAVELQRWDKVQELVASFIKRYPNDSRAPQAAYLEGEAYLNNNRFEDAYNVFTKHTKLYPQFQQADRVLFLAGYSALFLEKYQEATDFFARFRQQFPKSPLAENNLYWNAMTAVFAKNYPEIRTRFNLYLKEYPQGTFKEEAIYRMAAADYGEKKYEEARKKLMDWVKTYPQNPLTDEVRALAGDAWFAEGYPDEGIKMFSEVGPASERLYEYAQFQIGKALRLTEQYEKMVDHFKKFIDKNPNSGRVVEAYHWTGWGLRQLDQIEDARRFYRLALEKYGSDLKSNFVEDLFIGYAKLFPTVDDKAALISELQKGKDDLLAAGKPIQAARYLWLMAQLQRRSNPDQARLALLELARPDRFKPEQLSQRLCIDLGELLVTEKRYAEAETYLNILANAPKKTRFTDRALAGLGLIALAKGDQTKALTMFDRFEAESGSSILLPKILESKVEIYKSQKRFPEAITTLEKILETPAAKGKPWVQALYQLGQLNEQTGKAKEACAYYERIYILYGRYRDWVSKAYLARGKALESLQLKPQAIETYEAFLKEADLASFEEYKAAQQRLAELKPGANLNPTSEPKPTSS